MVRCRSRTFPCLSDPAPLPHGPIADDPLTPQDKDREYYLGHSLQAPVGRWQNGKDLTWYNKDRNDSDAAERERQEELRKVKEAEEDALAQAL